MIFAHVIFYIFSVMSILFALGVIFSANPVHSALSLVAVFFCMAAVWIILQAQFLGIILVLVYVGAVMTLFLFVVMMLNVQVETLRGRMVRYLPAAIAISVVVFLLLLTAVLPRYFGTAHFPAPAAETYNNVAALGIAMYTDYLYPFELAGVILLVAMIACITLSHRGPRNRKVQHPGKQVQVRKEDRLRVVKMKSGGEQS